MKRTGKGLIGIFVMLTMVLGLSFAGQAMYQQPEVPYFPDEFEELPEEMLEFFPDPDVELNSPYFMDEERESFTTHEEMMEFLYDLKAQSDRFQMRIVGQSQEGRELPLLVFNKEGMVDPADLQAQDRPIVWTHGTVHGNEPAAREGSLALAHELATTDWGEEMLEEVTVLVYPGVNPDGLYYFQRATANQIDINRDHMKLTLPETRAMHNAYNEYKPHVAVDNHELGAVPDEEWLEEFNIIDTTADVYTLSPRNANVPRQIIDVADDLFRSNVDEALAAEGLRHRDYTIGERIEDGKPTANTGGFISVIGRNAMGLVPSFSFLVETPQSGDYFYPRRVYSQLITNKSFVETTANHSAYVLDIVEGAREETARLGAEVCEDDKVAVEQERVPFDVVWEFIDVEKNEIIEMDVTLYDHPEPVLERVRPYAYIFPPAYHDIAERLKFGGAEVRRLAEPVELEVEALELVDKDVADTYYEGHFRKWVETEKFETEKFFPAGSYMVRMDQPYGNAIVELMEPEASASFVMYNFIPLGERGDEYPVYRLMDDDIHLNTHIVESIPDFKDYHYNRGLFFEDPR